MIKLIIQVFYPTNCFFKIIINLKKKLWIKKIIKNIKNNIKIFHNWNKNYKIRCVVKSYKSQYNIYTYFYKSINTDSDYSQGLKIWLASFLVGISRMVQSVSVNNRIRALLHHRHKSDIARSSMLCFSPPRTRTRVRGRAVEEEEEEDWTCL